MKKLKHFAFLLGLLSIPALAIMPQLSQSAFAADDICSLPNVSEAVKAASGCNDSLPELPDVVVNIIYGVIAAAAIVSVIYIVYGGVQYMTSSGDTTKTTKARNTIFFALIGLVICVLAFAIVKFFISNVINYTPTTGTITSMLPSLDSDSHQNLAVTK